MSAPMFFNLFTDPNGALVYFLAAIALSLAALWMALGQRLRSSEERAAGRYVIAGLLTLACWALLLIGAAFVLTGRVPSQAVLPLLDRTVEALIVLIVGWAFATADAPNESRLVGTIAFVIGLTLIGVFVYSEIRLMSAPVTGFSASPFGIAWAVTGLGVVIFGAASVLLRSRRVADAPLKLLFFLLLAVGYGATLYGTTNKLLIGDDSGVLRLAFLAALPVWLAVIYRLVIARLSQTADESQRFRALPTNGINAGAEPPVVAAGREAVAVLKALGDMLAHDAPEDLLLQVTVSVASALKADVVALLALDDAEYADVLVAYDNIRQKPIAAMAVKRDEQPTLKAAIEERTQRTLSQEENLNELVDLYTRLDIQRLGPAYFQPLTRDGVPVAVLVVALPYSQRKLRDNETQLLTALAPIAARLVGIGRAAQRTSGEDTAKVIDNTANQLAQPPLHATEQAEVDAARGQIAELSDKVRNLQIELDYERSRLAQVSGEEGLSISQQIAALTEERQQLSSEREKLSAALQESQARILGMSADENVYAPVIDSLQHERDELQAQKTQLEAQLADIRKRGPAPAPAVLRRVLTTLAEEKANLLVERNQIAEQLTLVQEQLRSLGIDGPAGLTQLVAQLTEERNYYRTLAERAAQDREVLLTERQRIVNQVKSLSEREDKLAALEDSIRRLAQDREALASQRGALRQERDSLRLERDAALIDREKQQQEIARLRSESAALQKELDEASFFRNQAQTALSKIQAEHTALQTERDQLAAGSQGDQALLQQFGAEGIDKLKEMIDSLTEQRSDLEHQLLHAQSQLRIFREALKKTQAKLSRSIPLPESVAVSASQAEVMLSIAQELRTPMSSIIGYGDLLLGESVGILGALQRQFLQRIKANADRLGTLLDDFVRVTAIDTGQLKLQPIEINPVELIDDALTATRTQFREKGITLRMDVPDRLPALTGDRDAIEQIVIRLLNNACLASPTDGEVTISAHHEPSFIPPETLQNGSAPMEAILITVRDQGGGIPLEEQARVFTRLYRADNPLVQGLGDTGVGLSVARALTEAHGGRIWLESQPGVGSVFHVALPLHRRLAGVIPEPTENNTVESQETYVAS